MKIYTKGGDQGQTSLASGDRVAKDDLRVQLYGEADELNSQLGLSISLLPDESKQLAIDLKQIQLVMFEMASELAGLKKVQAEGAIRESDILFLETAIDQMQTELAPLRAFILPGGHASASCLHVARTVCRRLERQMVASHNKRIYFQKVKPENYNNDDTKSNQSEAESSQNIIVSKLILKYINRLSDYLFVAARYANLQAGHTDIEWHARK